MHATVVLKVVGVLLMMYSITMIPPALVSMWYNDGSEFPFFAGFVITLVTGLICWLPVYRRKGELRTRDGFIIVVMFWTVLGVIRINTFIDRRFATDEFYRCGI